MEINMKLKISFAGIFLVLVYLTVVITFIATGYDVLLFLWELFTIISSFYMLLFLEMFLYDCKNKIFKHYALICIAGCIILTSVAHFTNLTVTNSLIKQGINVPDYFIIGQWPSVMMVFDYLAWGLFLGVAFICTALIINKNKAIKWTLLICGCFCIIAFMGIMINIEYLWYFAVLGYTVGIIIICIQQIMDIKNDKINAYT